MAGLIATARPEMSLYPRDSGPTAAGPGAAFVRALAISLLVSASCGAGVPIFHVAHGYTARLTNAADIPLIVYADGRSRPDIGVYRLAPGEYVEASWNVPSGPDDARKHRVEATDLVGGLVFCEEYSFQDIVDLKQKIQIVKDHLECAAESFAPQRSVRIQQIRSSWRSTGRMRERG